jgi:hypothetical protein
MAIQKIAKIANTLPTTTASGGKVAGPPHPTAVPAEMKNKSHLKVAPPRTMSVPRGPATAAKMAMLGPKGMTDGSGMAGGTAASTKGPSMRAGSSAVGDAATKKVGMTGNSGKGTGY